MSVMGWMGWKQPIASWPQHVHTSYAGESCKGFVLWKENQKGLVLCFVIHHSCDSGPRNLSGPQASTCHIPTAPSIGSFNTEKGLESYQVLQFSGALHGSVFSFSHSCSWTCALSSNLLLECSTHDDMTAFHLCDCDDANGTHSHVLSNIILDFSVKMLLGEIII